MYEGYYRLDADPFQLIPDPAFRIAHERYAQVFDRLEQALRQHEPLIMLTGELGVGKTLMLGEMLATLADDRFHCAHLTATRLDGEELLQAAALGFGLAGELGGAEMSDRLEDFLRRQTDGGQHCILAIDEAQELAPEALERVAALSRVRVGDRSILQVLVAGLPVLRTPEFERRLGTASAACELGALDAPATEAYIRYRLHRAGWQGDPDITVPALQAIHQLTRGIPRSINMVCGRLLVLGATEGRHKLDEPEVVRVAADLCDEMLLDPACLARLESVLSSRSESGKPPSPVAAVTAGHAEHEAQPVPPQSAGAAQHADAVPSRPVSRSRRGPALRYVALGPLLSLILVVALFAGAHPNGLDALGHLLLGGQTEVLSRVAAIGEILRFDTKEDSAEESVQASDVPEPDVPMKPPGSVQKPVRQTRPETAGFSALERPTQIRPEAEIPRPRVDPRNERPGTEASNLEAIRPDNPRVDRPEEVERPELQRPEPGRPEVERPEVVRPEVVRPEVERPAAERPEIARPEIERPDVDRPDIARPDVERPDIERPAIERPEVERPEVERPTVERPEIERPAIERPEVERPAIERPDIERPEIERPTIERPEIERPDIERPEVERPDIERPDIERPEVERPEIERPDIERPEVERPEIERPEVERPDIERPDIERPDIERPDIERPEIERPDIERPDIERPEIERPDIERPEVERPDIERPDIERPDIERPDIERPEVERPDIERPEIERPDIERPEVERPDIERPDIERPDIERPEIERPEVERPDIERPEIERPDIERPEVERPDIERPDVERPDIGRPDIERPDIERPDIERPDIERPDRD